MQDFTLVYICICCCQRN